MRPSRLRTVAVAAALELLLALPLAAVAAEADKTCGQPGQWLIPGKAAGNPAAAALSSAALIERIADRQAVLLGEAHDSAEDHRWQLHTLAQLHARRPQLALALEMFPRRLQPVLDRWVAGELAETEFLRQAEWEKVWGFDARDYLPLFHFARMNRLPMLAMNVERTLVDAVAREGWDAVAESKKEGISRPAKPSAGYLKFLRRIFEHHPEKTKGEKAFATFAEAQTVWDRGMAQIIAEQLGRQPDSLVVGILGAGHVRHGYGVAHQLRDLGVGRVATLVTWKQAEACSGIAADLADAVRIIAPPADNPPRLGISMEVEKDGVRIVSVVAGSIAEKSGIKPDDLVVEARGLPVRDMQALRYAVQRQTAGTWLPLKVKRGSEELEIVVRFPVDSQ
ncbi:MAG TPA: ChaN family lipoprotein [Azospira sp.]|nr:ChaN family lipoprotein [Azospira sp.]